MELEQQLASLELCKKLKSLGIRQESLFYWYEGFMEPFIDYSECGNIHKHYALPEKICSAFTVAELLDLLPPNIDEWGLCFDAASIATRDGIKSYWSGTYADYAKKMFNEISDINITNMIAKMLIYLIENGLYEKK